jgi:hypothetical protein
MFAILLGVPFGLYAFLTSDQRRTTRSIRVEAIARGWRFRKQRWQGNPAAFRIDGKTAEGLPWTLTSGNSSDNSDQLWSALLILSFPVPAGGPDFAIEPRESRKLKGPLGLGGPMFSLERFSHYTTEVASGWRPFDDVYRVLAIPRRFSQPPVDPALAQRILGSLADSIKPHSLYAWRHASALEIQARLPDSPNVPTVSWLVALGEDLIARLPPRS